MELMKWKTQLRTQTKGKEELNSNEKYKKMIAINSQLSKFTLNINGLHSPVKGHRLGE